MRLLSLGISVLLGCFIAGDAWSEPLIIESSSKQVSLVELYTSEGCSSCPPAEKWLQRQESSDDLYQNFVPISFHVDYWNHLGWVDPFASKEHTLRQKAYAKTWKAKRVYTPGLVLNGQEWKGWHGWTKRILQTGAEPGVLTVVSKGNGVFDILFKPKSRRVGSVKIFAALTGMGFKMSVKSGENAGKDLKHSFTVVSYKELGKVQPRKDASYKTRVVLKPKEGVGTPERYSVAIWVEGSFTPIPIQATGGFLPKDYKF